MGRIDEARAILELKSTSATGISAMGIATFDIDRVMDGYQELFHQLLPDEPLSDNRRLETEALHGYILWHIYQDFVGNEKFESFLSELYPKLIAYQRHIYDHHCPLGHGLIVVEDVIDPLVNSLFACSNDALLELGYALGLPSDDLFDKNELTQHSMNELLWSKGMGSYQGYDAHAQGVIENHQSSGFLPVIAGVPDINQVLDMIQMAFGDDFRQEGHYSFPSYNFNMSDFSYTDRAKGAISSSINWLLIQGLSRYDMDDLSDLVMEDTLVLMERYGLFEYFDPRKALDFNGIGPLSPNSAAIYLNLIKEDF